MPALRAARDGFVVGALNPKTIVAGTAREWFTGSPRRMSAVGGAGGLVMFGLGASIAATGRRD